MTAERFAALVAQQPENEKFRFSLAQALLREARLPEAVVQLETCVHKKADWMMAQILLGKTLLALGRPTEARPRFETALQLAIAQDHEDPAREMQALLADLSPKERPDTD
ncbi:MAG: molecular chaperone DnaJ [Candidatus Didemnitutus sp.]|nr:molecular chaperone DnaJ [Candidatus Didemnitutus sp.]